VPHCQGRRSVLLQGDETCLSPAADQLQEGVIGDVVVAILAEVRAPGVGDLEDALLPVVAHLVVVADDGLGVIGLQGRVLAGGDDVVPVPLPVSIVVQELAGVDGEHHRGPGGQQCLDRGDLGQSVVGYGVVRFCLMGCGLPPRLLAPPDVGIGLVGHGRQGGHADGLRHLGVGTEVAAHVIPAVLKVVRPQWAQELVGVAQRGVRPAVGLRRQVSQGIVYLGPGSAGAEAALVPYRREIR